MNFGSLLASLRNDMRTDTVRGRMIRSAAFNAALQACATLFAFVASLVYARALGPHDFGLYAYVAAWALVLALPAGMGLPQYVIREGAKSPQRIRSIRRWADRWIMASGSAVALLMACAAFIPMAAGARWLFVVAATQPMLASLAGVRSAALQSLGQSTRSQWPRLLLAPILMLTILLLLWAWRGHLEPMDLVLMMTVSAMTPLLINSLQLRRAWPQPQEDTRFHAPASVGWPFMLVSGLFLLNSRIDLIMLGSLRGAHDAGVYAVASRAAEVTAFAMTAANLVLGPSIARLYRDGNIALLQRMLNGAMRRLLLASAPIGLILVVGARPLITLLYGPGYADGAAVLQILAISQVVVVSSGPLGVLLNMTGHERALAKNMIIAVALNALLNFATIPAWGATGAAIATASSLVFSRLLLRRQSWNLLGLKPSALKR